MKTVCHNFIKINFIIILLHTDAYHLLNEEDVLNEGHPVRSMFHPGICPLHLHYHKCYKVVSDSDLPRIYTLLLIFAKTGALSALAMANSNT